MPFQPGNQLAKRKHKKTIEAEKAIEYIRQRVTNELQPIMDKAIEQAKEGDTATRRDLMDRAYGKPKETIEHQGLEFTWPDES